VTDPEVAALAAHFGRTAAEFRREHCRSVYGRTSLRERPDGDCVLLGPEGCTAYGARPTQCRTFPFWAEHLRSPAAWARLAKQCPGLNRGPVHDPEEIRRKLETG
jgi:Fe-S-cluster containining protein